MVRACRRCVQVQSVNKGHLGSPRHLRLLATYPVCQCLPINPPRSGIRPFARITLSPPRQLRKRERERAQILLDGFEGEEGKDSSHYRNPRTVKTVKSRAPVIDYRARTESSRTFRYRNYPDYKPLRRFFFALGIAHDEYVNRREYR